MEYCGNCGEPAEGRFCRMCGAPVGMAQVASPAEATQMMVGATPGYAGEPTQLVGAPYGGEPTEQISPTPAEFDSLFRSEDGQPGMHGQTQLLPPVVESDYRMSPPGGGAAAPPGAAEYDRYLGGDDEPRSNRPVILATVGAVIVAAAVILGLLYLGNQSTDAPTSGTTATGGASSTATASAGSGQIAIPSDGAKLTSAAPTTASTTTAAGSFQGDSLPLGPGSQGSLVKWVQERLKQLGYYQGSTDGTFDQATAAAVQQFQATAGVTGDPASTVGLHTLVALEAAGSTPNLRTGSRSSEVGRLNAALSYATGTRLSGDRYTMQTTAAVFGYQQAVGLTPTGQVDAATWAKLQTGTLATSG